MRTVDIDTFISRCKEVHGDKYDYSKTKYASMRDDIEVICHKHGHFKQNTRRHINGQKCPSCQKEIRRKSKYTKETYIKHANKIHENRYDYSKINFRTVRDKIYIQCPKHGGFYQRAYSHLQGRGCPKCGNHKKGIQQRLSESDFVSKANKIHSNVYDYSKVKYKNMRAPIEIVCRKHGSFFQTGHNHLKGHGCPICNNSHGERIIRKELTKLKIKYSYQHIFNSCRCINVLPFDFFIPSKNILIEYDGEQHYIPIDYYGGKRLSTKLKNETE